MLPAFTAISDGWLTNKLIIFHPTTLPRQMKCRPRARCNIRRPFLTRCHRSRHQHSRQQTHFRQRYHEAVSRGAASAWMISASSFASNLIDYFCRVQGLPGCAPQQTWCSDFQRLAERTLSAGTGHKSSGNSMPRSTATFSWTAPGNRHERAHCSLNNDRRLQGTHRECARKHPKQQLWRRWSPHAPLPIPSVWPAPKPRPPCSLP